MQVINVLSERQIHIISILLNTEGSISGVSLSKNLGITTRTLRNDISNINDEIKNKKVKIYSNPAHGYWIKKEDKKSMKKEIREIRNTIKQAIASTSDERIVMLFYLLIREKSLKTDKLLERFYVSKTTLNKDINKLKLIIKEFNPNIFEKSKNLTLSYENEEEFRKLISNFIVNNYEKNLYNLKKYLYLIDDKLDEKFMDVYNLLKDILVNQNIVLTDKSLTMLSFEIVIFNTRELNGHKVLIKKDDKYRNIIWHKESLESVLKCNISDAFFVSIKNLLSTKRMLSNEDFNGFNSQENKYIYLEFANFIKSKTSMDIFDNEGIKDHINAMLLYGRLEGTYNNQMVNEIKDMFPYAFNLSSGINSIVKKYKQKELTEIEIATLAIRLISILNNNKKKNNVLIVCDYGQTYALFIRYKIEMLFAAELNIIDVIPAYYLENTLKKQRKIDLIISTSITDDLKKIKTIVVSPIINDNDVRKIRKFLQNCEI